MGHMPTHQVSIRPEMKILQRPQTNAFLINEIEPTAAITMFVSVFHERYSFSPLLPQPNHNCPLLLNPESVRLN